MLYKDYIAKMKLIQIIILRFLEREENLEENYQNLIKLFGEKKILENKHETKSVLYLISKISNNHHRETDFFNRIEKILQFFSSHIKIFFTNSEIFTIFKHNKRLLLYQIESKLFFIDENIYNLFTKNENLTMNYLTFFSPEINRFFKEIYSESNNEYDEEEEEYEDKVPNEFIEKRKIGENEDRLCELIRKDLIDDFKVYVKENGISLNQTIKTSIFETNPFLQKNKDTSLIEYAVFFGSHQIFCYLYLNEVEFTPRIWLYAIHSNNIKFIYFAEEKNHFNENVSYEKCYKEAVKCHHIEIANFIQINYLNQRELKNKALNNFDENFYLYAFRYYNFMYFPDNMNNKFFIYYACEYDYLIIVNIILKNNSIDLYSSIRIFYHF